MKGLIVIILGLIAIFYGSFCGVKFITTPGEIAQIEQLRKDSVLVSNQASEDVMGQITKWNQRIVSNQTYNKIWWTDWIVPDIWENVKIIEIPSR